ncbi:uncharacterized protein [Physcomitrium patens]|uniref:uncharacterized protein isoform X3 n=1 Tax=Physcomitrium patens TaxID=3218 RepID=UPI00024AF5F2
MKYWIATNTGVVKLQQQAKDCSSSWCRSLRVSSNPYSFAPCVPLYTSLRPLAAKPSLQCAVFSLRIARICA